MINIVHKIEKLTSEQLALISTIHSEWTKVAFDTSPIDKSEAEAAIHLAYECASIKPPEQILWFDNPHAAINWIALNATELLELIDYSVIPDDTDTYTDDYMVGVNVNKDVSTYVNASVRRRIKELVYWSMPDAVGDISNILSAIWYVLLTDSLSYESYSLIEDAIEGYANGPSSAPMLSYYAYFQAIGVKCPKIEGLIATAKHCGFWWAFDKVAVATPKPLKINLDSNCKLHALSEAAVRYKGFNVYAYHGTVIPPEYGTVHPTQWQAKWLLEETNAELRRVLIQGIGYTRLIEELKAVELDSWHGYVLLKIDADADVEPIVLLKMTCPSTACIHVLRIPPNTLSAREAIKWVNWGIDAQDFLIQS